MFSHRQDRARRGVVLMVILGLMAMFGMIAIAFVLLSGQGKRAAQMDARAEQYAETPRELLQVAARQALRGSTASASPMREHSLLDDRYGGPPTYGDMLHTGASAVVLVPSGAPGFVGPLCGGQLIGFTPARANQIYDPTNPPQPEYEYTALANPYRFVGCVLTMHHGVARNKSTRIVGYDAANNLLLILPFEGVPPAAFLADVQSNNALNSRREYTINGFPFTGTGFGWNGGTGLLDAPLPPEVTLNTLPPDPIAALYPIGLPYALLPNRAGDPAAVGLAGGGKANEDYDAPDYHNMLLAAVGDLDGDGAPDWIIPSMHRPALVNYWYHRLVYDWLIPDVGLSEADAWKAVMIPVEMGPPLYGNDTIDAPTRDAIVQLKRRISFRPLRDLHNSFDGSNPKWRAWETPALISGLADPKSHWLSPDNPVLNGPWDVDNDGDGIADGIWVDLGLPVRSAPDGRRYKPLISYLCVDLDGRLNLNANGCLAQTLQDSSGASPYYDYPVEAGPFWFADNTNPIGANTQARLMRGQGYGPPEVSLRPVLASFQEYRHLLMGKGATHPTSGAVRWLDGRYGEAAPPTVVDADGDGLPDDPRAVAPGRSFVPGDLLRDNPQMLLADDPLSRNKRFEYSSLRSYSDGIPGAFGTPPDLKGTMAIGLDVRGQPMYWPMADPAVNSLVAGSPSWYDRFAWPSVNEPFELNLSRNTARALPTPAPIDNPFSVYELERVLRMYDRDAGRLADRLALLAPGLSGHRDKVTTESWHVPVPAVAALHDEADPSRNVRLNHFTDLLRLRVPGIAPVYWSQLVPPEMLAGLKMNLNRPFGNGLDDNNNGVVDEPGLINWATGTFDPVVPSEVADPANPGDTSAWEQLPLVDAAGNVTPVELDHCAGVDVDGDGQHDRAADPARVAVDRAQARQLFARYLYILAIMVAGKDSSGDSIYQSGSWNLLRANWDHRSLAQWAVNVVDFCDRDSIMTPFVYDPNPLDGWNPDGTQVVWGCERPELLIGETVAFHDLRTEDTDLEPDGKRTDAANDPDDDYDQRIRPVGSLFIELYNPWTGQEHLPGEFCYDRTAGAWRGGVILNQTTPTGDPVWRILIAVPEEDPADPDFQPRDPDVQNLAPASVERSAYFVNPGANAYDDGATVRYYPTNQQMAPILPGRYAVIGPAGQDDSRDQSTYMGYQVGDPDHNGEPPPRRIRLVQGADPNTQQVEVYASNVNTPDVDDLGNDIWRQPAVAVVMDAVTNPPAATHVPPRFSVTEPSGGYPVYEDTVNNQYNPVRDEPLDKTIGAHWSDPTPTTPKGVGHAKSPAGDSNGGTDRRYRVVYLQRLANPLAPYHQTLNPFRTVDAMQVDLTSFNGMTSIVDPDPLLQPAQHEEFYTVQRGAHVHENLPSDQRNNIWAAEPETPDADQPPQPPARCVHQQPVGHSFFNNDFAHTLGRLNGWFGAPRPGGGPGNIYLGDPMDDPTDPNDDPWPWLAWLNRPLVNEMELLLVPNRRSSELLRKCTVGNEGNSPYFPTDPDDPAPPIPPNVISFNHLGWLLGTPPARDPGTGTGRPPRASRLHRLLDFVHVPSRFVGTEIQANPNVMAAAWPPANWLPVADSPFPFRPPYNGLPLYREPGRVNINTIFSPNVWLGVTNNFGAMANGATDYWDEVQRSRRGYVPTWGNLNENSPTQFANPFRSFPGGYLVPLPSLQTGVIAEEVHATMARGDAVPHTAGPASSEVPLFRHQSADAFQNTARNPSFRHQLLQKLAGVTTTRSNVYALWVTLGYFEVGPAPALPAGWSPALYQAVYPQGYQLGPELGSDRGEVKRHRAFYIIDRSIPVGFERGRDRNVDDAILLERFIE